MAKQLRTNPFRNTMTGPTTCSVCGKKLKYAGRGSYVCESCNNVEYDDFGRIDQYLEVHGPSSAPVLSRALGIQISRIHELVAQGRLEPLPTDHKTLDAQILERAMAAEKEEKQMTGTYIDPASRDEERMRFLRNNKNKLNQQNKQ